MKIKRHKKAHKYINFYINNFGFHQPYQILIDGTFCFAALKVSFLKIMFLNFKLTDFLISRKKPTGKNKTDNLKNLFVILPVSTLWKCLEYSLTSNFSRICCVMLNYYSRIKLTFKISYRSTWTVN